MDKEKTFAQRLHDARYVQLHIEQIIEDAFEKYEPEIYEKLEFHVGSDDYDNSIEIYFDISLPYPYEPCKEIRQIIFDLGFSQVYWNFTKDETEINYNGFKTTYDEIRGYEPRHYRHGDWINCKYGYADKRFNEKEWEEKYNFRNKFGS